MRDRAVHLVLALVIAAGCARQDAGGKRDVEPPPREPSVAPKSSPLVFAACPEDRAALVGKRVTLRGVLTRTKQPTVCGFDVDSSDGLSDREVIVTGVVGQAVVPARPSGGEVMATRGPGTYYRLDSPDGGRLAKPVAAGEVEPR
jgi:hypothetical protein